MDWIFWLILIIILAVIELATASLLTIWFVLSGIVALILSFFIDNVAITCTIFAVLGIFLLFTTRPILREYLPSQKKVRDLEKLIGRDGVVVKDIYKGGAGLVKIGRRKYKAISSKNLKADTEVYVKTLDELNLVVEKKN